MQAIALSEETDACGNSGVTRIRKRSTGRIKLKKRTLTIFERENLKRRKAIKEAPWHGVYLSWDKVLQRKIRLEEEQRTKFINYSRTNGFQDCKPNTKTKIRFESRRCVNEAVIIPCNGIPFMWIGNRTFVCHLGKRNNDSKRLQMKRKERMSTGGRRSISLPSKKVGCGAYFTISKIARFPDFKIPCDTLVMRNKAINELSDAWHNFPEKVRFFIEYHVRRPKDESHSGHELENIAGCSKFHEAVDDRIIQLIEALTREGYSCASAIKKQVQLFVKKELSVTGEDLERHRYCPTLHDVRNAMKKARLQIQNEGNSVQEVQCCGLVQKMRSYVSQLKDSDQLPEDSQEQHLASLQSHLQEILQTLKQGKPLPNIRYNFPWKSVNEEIDSKRRKQFIPSLHGDGSNDCKSMNESIQVEEAIEDSNEMDSFLLFINANEDVSDEACGRFENNSNDKLDKKHLRDDVQIKQEKSPNSICQFFYDPAGFYYI